MVSIDTVIRIHWSDPQPDAPAEAGWRIPALIIAALFLNFSFWYDHGGDLWMVYPLYVYGLIVAGTAALLTALFFVGPSFACRGAEQGLMAALENSIGRVPGYGARFCCVWFLIAWIADVVSLPMMGQLQFIIRRRVSGVGAGMAAVVLLIYLFLTGLQSVRTSAKMAFFTNKLALVVLIAAVVRVHEGWPAVLTPFPGAGHSAASEIWRGVARLGFYVAPLAFFAADYAGAKASVPRIRMLAVMGLAVPICAGLTIVGMLNVATHASPYYQPSLNPNIAMALWGKAASSSLPPRMMLTVITVFGAVRFGARALATVVSVPWLGQRTQRMLLACSIASIAWLSVRPWAAGLERSLELSTAILTVFAGVLSADAVYRNPKQVGRRPRIDWVGTSAVFAGLIAAVAVNAWAAHGGWGTWFHPWLLPSYAVAFMACLSGRMLQGGRHPRAAGADFVRG